MKEESGELSVTSTRTEDGELLVAVSDSGIGLSEAGPERIFEAFFTTKPLEKSIKTWLAQPGPALLNGRFESDAAGDATFAPRSA